MLARLDNPQSRQIQAETLALEARSARLASEGLVAAARRWLAKRQPERGSPASSFEPCFRTAFIGGTASARAAEAAATISSLTRSLALAEDNVNRLAPLAAKNIVPQTELANAQREVVDLQGRIAAAREQQGRAMAAVAEANSQASEASFTFRQEALNERSQVEQKLAVNVESLRGSRGFELRSPVDGVVNDVQVTTIGGFVQPGEKVMEVVPMGDKLLVETRVKPSDIAFIKVGDKALVKVTAYDFSTYGGLDGKVVQSADSIYDEVEREAYFIVIVEPKGLSGEGRRPAADQPRHDDRHADHHRPQERAELPAEAGPQGAQRRAARALIRAKFRKVRGWRFHGRRPAARLRPTRARTGLRPGHRSSDAIAGVGNRRHIAAVTVRVPAMGREGQHRLIVRRHRRNRRSGRCRCRAPGSVRQHEPPAPHGRHGG